MSKTIVAALIDRELESLAGQIELYGSDAELCARQGGLRNPGGNLALHLTGNLQHFIGGILGNSGYVRDRDAEFQRRDLSRAELLREVATTRAVVAKTLRELPDATWAAPYPVEFAGNRLRTDVFLHHLAAHLAYHLGQIDAHRRIGGGDEETPPSLGFASLFELSKE